MALVSPYPARNALLSSLPEVERNQLKSALRMVELPARTLLHDARVRFKHAYFPLRGCVSLLIELSDGFSTEVALIGNEGMIGAALVLERIESVTVAKVQIATTAMRISADALFAFSNELPTFRRRLLHYTAAQAARSMQLIACNAHHGLTSRLARVLLSLHDRADDPFIAVTHEGLASLLCAHRPSISIALKQLQQQGLIGQEIGTVSITDRAGLEQASCECYSIVHASERPAG